MHSVAEALNATWSPFVLVAGLLLIGHVASREGLFRFVGSRCARVPGSGRSLFILTMLAVAVVTAVLNLDTSVVFMTPVALSVARSKNTDEIAFLYGAVFMSNSASILLVGSNLTNLLIFGSRNEVGAAFVEHTWSSWVVAVTVTILVVLAWRWRPLRDGRAAVVSSETLTIGPGLFAVGAAVVLMLAVTRPAIWVFAVGVIVELVAVMRHRGSWREAVRATSPVTLSTLFAVALLVGWFARWSTLTTHLLTDTNVVVTAAVSTLFALVINNLPAASLFAAHPVQHPYALLLGLDFGPNIAVSGALSSLLWLRIARHHQARASLVLFTLVGTVVALLSISIALALG